MKKSDLIEQWAADTGLTKEIASKALNGLIAIITQRVAAGHDVQITGFATFSQGERAARIGRHPITKEALPIAASKTVKVSIGKEFKQRVKASAASPLK